MAQVDPLVRDVLPDVAAALQTGLLAEGEGDLAAQVDELRIVVPCGCGDECCGSFYTGPKPADGWEPSYRSVMIDEPSRMGRPRHGR